MGKTCAFLGNDYDRILGMKCGHRTPPNLKARIREHAVNLIENEDVDTFLVGEKGGYEVDAYDVVLDLQKEYPHIQIMFVVSNVTDLNEMGVCEASYVAKRRGFDDFILPPKCEFGYRKLGIVYRNRYIIANTDFIIAYNKYKGRAYGFCKTAENSGVKVIELGNVLNQE